MLDIIISNQSDTPIYKQIENQIQSLIMSGELEEGEILPSIRTLAQELRISSITTKRAYEDLEREGYIVSQVGRGSFVNARNKELLRERWVKTVEEKLEEAVDAAKMIEMPRSEFNMLLDILYEEE